METYDELEKLQTVFFALSDALKETDPKEIKEVLQEVSEMELKGPQFFEIYIARRHFSHLRHTYIIYRYIYIYLFI